MDILQYLSNKENQVAVTILLCTLFGFLGYRKKWFTIPASITVGILATIIVLKQDIYLLVFPFLFAFIGSLLSKKDTFTERKGRSTKQVLANAAPAIIFLLLVQDETLARNMVITVFAVALSDTMSSELGKKWRGTTVDFCSMKKMEPGLSGGISLQGSLAGLLGSLIIAIAAFIYPIDINLFFIILTFGFVGMFIDSIIGSIAQGKYLVGEKMMEVGNRNELVRGLHWLNNEEVNFISIIIAVLIAPL